MRILELNWAVRSALLLSTLVGASLVLAGCKSPSIVGRWQTASPTNAKMMVSYEFKSDGTFSSTAEMPMGETGMSITATGTGSYKIEKDRIEAKVSDFEIEGLPEQVMQQFGSRIKSQLKKPLTGALQWTSSDSFTVIEDRSITTMLFTRVKSKP